MNNTPYLGHGATPDCGDHKRALNALRFALTLGDADAWAALATIFSARLTETERAGIAYAALRSMNEAHAYNVASLTIFGTYAGEALQ